MASSVPVMSTPSSVNSLFSLETLLSLFLGSEVLGSVGFLVFSSLCSFFISFFLVRILPAS